MNRKKKRVKSMNRNKKLSLAVPLSMVVTKSQWVTRAAAVVRGGSRCSRLVALLLSWSVLSLAVGRQCRRRRQNRGAMGIGKWWVVGSFHNERKRKIRKNSGENTMLSGSRVPSRKHPCPSRIGSSVQVRIHTYSYVTNAYPYRIRTRHGYFEHKHVPMLQRCYISKL